LEGILSALSPNVKALSRLDGAHAVEIKPMPDHTWFVLLGRDQGQTSSRSKRQTNEAAGEERTGSVPSGVR